MIALADRKSIPTSIKKKVVAAQQGEQINNI
jgi:hypothetical protein